MHTLAKNSEHNERLIYDFLKKAYPDKAPSIANLIQDNIINGTQLVELAVSKVSGLKFCPVGYHQDFLDMSDVKTSTIQRQESYKKRVLKDGTKRRYKTITYTITVQDVNKKVGVLRIITWNPFLEKYHYFRIPPSAIFNRSILKITFDNETILPIGKYAQFEVDTFEEVGAPLTTREIVSTIVSNISEATIEEQIDKLLDLIQTKPQSNE